MKRSELLAGITSKATDKRIFRLKRRTKKRLVRGSLIVVNVAAVISISAFIYVSQRGSTNDKALSFIAAEDNQSLALDEVSSNDIAATVAAVVRLDEATSVQNQADSYNAQLSITSSDDQVVDKPQVVSSGAETKSNKDIISYTVASGDTITQIANKHGISTDSIKWSNNITGDTVAVGKVLQIPPRNGIIYEVKQGDSADTIASKYRASKDQIISANDAELTGLKVGVKILIPDGLQPVAPRQNNFSYYAGFSFGNSALYGGNGYTYGYCTWYAANRRADIGRPIPRNLGNAATWLPVARLAGLDTGTEPRAGAVLWHTNTSIAWGLGHVAFVEKVNADGSVYITEMNMVGWNRKSDRTIQPSELGAYRFIY